MAILKEKIHHLDDMLKSQQRKVRHMIEQVRSARLQNAKHGCSCLREAHSHFDFLFLAPELPHGDPGAGPRDQRAGGESGVLGSRGERRSRLR